MKKNALWVLLLLWITPPLLAAPAVRTWTIERGLDAVYPVVHDSLENNHFFVVFEVDIQRNLAGFAERWGQDYNRNGLEGIRAMVFCNGWYANAVGNADPDMLALCPLHITLIQQQGHTRVLFTRPGVVAAGSKAESVAREIEAGVAKAIDQAAAELAKAPPGKQ